MRFPALVAVLLLALLPTLGRVARSSAEADRVVQLCTVQGLKTVHLASDLISGTSGMPGMPGHGTGRDGDDCSYCPLLAGLVIGFAAVLGLLASPPPQRPLTRQRAHRLPWHHPSGLGSRGPPALACIAA